MDEDYIIKEDVERKAKLQRRAVNKLNFETKEISAGVIVEGDVEELVVEFNADDNTVAMPEKAQKRVKNVFKQIF